VKPKPLDGRPHHLDLVRMILDHQLLDSDHVECGKVDDVALELHGGGLRAVALLTGPGAAAVHLPRWIRPIVFFFGGRRETMLPWKELAMVESRIRLRSRAEALGLNGGEDDTRRILENVPGAE
jgi:hypothetical protein